MSSSSSQSISPKKQKKNKGKKGDDLRSKKHFHSVDEWLHTVEDALPEDVYRPYKESVRRLVKEGIPEITPKSINLTGVISPSDSAYSSSSSDVDENGDLRQIGMPRNKMAKLLPGARDHMMQQALIGGPSMVPFGVPAYFGPGDSISFAGTTQQIVNNDFDQSQQQGMQQQQQGLPQLQQQQGSQPNFNQIFGIPPPLSGNSADTLRSTMQQLEEISNNQGATEQSLQQLDNVRQQQQNWGTQI
jgi:hypothetical protein